MPEAEWNDEHTKIICELFEEQVRAGNRPNTHLNNIGYRQVASKFQQRTQLLYTSFRLRTNGISLRVNTPPGINCLQ
uniref:Myb/SANT-like domain-containing protein n=1 Tax=Arundo donax TaxID=35708 RepID=A0A0A9H1M8_ARUDO